MASQPLYRDAVALPARPADPALAGRLTSLAAGLDAGFLRTGERLDRAIGTIRALIAGLDSAAEALDPAAAQAAIVSLSGAARQIEALPRALTARDTQLADIAATSAALTAHVEDIQRVLRMLGVYGMNIKIAGAWGDFRIFVDDMDGRLKHGGAEVAGFVERLALISDSVARVRSADAHVLSAQSSVGAEAPARIAQCSARLSQHLADAAASTDRLKALASDIEQALGRVLGAIQVADSTRQRIEHVATGLAMLADAAPPAAAAGVVHRVLAAQLNAADAAHRAESHNLRAALDRLATAGRHLTELVGRQTSGQGQASLRDLESGIVEIGRMTGRLQDTAARSSEMAGCIADGLDDLTRRNEAIDQIVRDVKEIAINTRLLCRGQGQQGAAVAVIAVEVATQAIRLQEAARHIEAALAHLGACNERLRGQTAGEGAGDLGRALGDALAVIRAACAQADAALATSGAQSRDLVTLLADVGAEAGDVDALHATLGDCVRALDHPSQAADAADTAWLASFLPRLAALYTMAEERRIHAQLLPPGLAPAAAPAPAAVLADDDGLF